MNWSY